MIILLILVIIIFLLQFFMRLSIKLEIENLRFMLPKTDNKLKNNESKILLKVYLFNKIKIAQIDLKKSNLKNNKLNNKLIEKMIPHRFNLKYNEDIIIFLKNDTYILEKLDLKIEVGVEDAAITAITVGILYTIIGNFLRNKIKDTKYQKYEITPIYKGKNMMVYLL